MGGPAALKQLLALCQSGSSPPRSPFESTAVSLLAMMTITVATASLVGFHAGALIYLGTFAVANNFDYRLVFLLLTLPQLVEWVRTPAHRLSSLASSDPCRRFWCCSGWAACRSG